MISITQGTSIDAKSKTKAGFYYELYNTISQLFEIKDNHCHLSVSGSIRFLVTKRYISHVFLRMFIALNIFR